MVVAIAICAVALWLALAVRAWWRSARARGRARRARRGEEAAADLLESLGFVIEDAQSHRTYAVRAGTREVVVSLRADYLVTRGASRWVAEVKTGAVAPKIENTSTRRQLLEYRVAFDVDGVLLVDVESRRVEEVEFLVALDS